MFPVRIQKLRLDTADLLGTGTMVAVLMQEGTVSSESEVLKMSEITSAS